MRSPMILALCTFCLLLSPPLLADEVVKKDGKSVKGVIVSQTSSTIRIMDSRGRTHRISMRQVDSVLEGPEIGDDELDGKIEEIDSDDADALATLATWARDKKKKGWKCIALLALRVDEDHDDTRHLLGHEKVGDTWYSTKKQAATARKKYLDEQRKAEGYIKWRGAWIRKEDRALAQKDPKAFVKTEEGVWREKSVVMKEKGFVLVNGKWAKAGTAEDMSDIKRFKELMGENIWILTSKHFRVWVQQIPPDQVGELSQLCEKTYDWFLEQMALDPETDLFRGNRANFFVFKDKNTALDWYKNYRNRFSLGEQFSKLLERGGGNILSSGSLLATHIPTQDGSRLRHQLVNHAAHCCLQWFSPGLSRGGPEAWLAEGFGVHAEHEILGNGVVVHSTLAKYGNSGGVANKAFATKDARDTAKGTVRQGTDEPFATLNKLDLNSLNPDHYSKAYTFIAWLMKTRADDFRKWIRARNTAETLAALQAALGWSPEKADSVWRDLVKKEF